MTRMHGTVPRGGMVGRTLTFLSTLRTVWGIAPSRRCGPHGPNSTRHPFFDDSIAASISLCTLTASLI
jgi:hypothetical protein